MQEMPTLKHKVFHVGFTDNGGNEQSLPVIVSQYLPRNDSDIHRISQVLDVSEKHMPDVFGGDTPYNYKQHTAVIYERYDAYEYLQECQYVPWSAVESDKKYEGFKPYTGGN